MSRRSRSISAVRSMELSDLWCRLIAPKQVAALEGFKREGIDLVRDHHDDFPPEFWHWDEIGRKITVTQFLDDQAIRTEVFDALRKVLDRYDYLVSPTLACLPVDNATDRNTRRVPRRSTARRSTR